MDEKEQQQLRCLFIFAKILSEYFLWIETKSHKVWAS